jgi:hypothetical protein
MHGYSHLNPVLPAQARFFPNEEIIQGIFRFPMLIRKDPVSKAGMKQLIG